MLHVDVAELGEYLGFALVAGIVIAEEEAQFAAYNKITAKKDFVLYPDFTHEPLPEQIDRTFNFMQGLKS